MKFGTPTRASECNPGPAAGSRLAEGEFLSLDFWLRAFAGGGAAGSGAGAEEQQGAGGTMWGRGLLRQRLPICPAAAPKSSRRRTVGENMANMAVTARAKHLGAAHKKAVVLFLIHRFRVNRRVEAGPSRARVELRIGREQRVAAALTDIGSTVLATVVFTGKCTFRALLTAHLVLLRGQYFTPFGIRFHDFVASHLPFSHLPCGAGPS